MRTFIRSLILLLLVALSVGVLASPAHAQPNGQTDGGGSFDPWG